MWTEGPNHAFEHHSLQLKATLSPFYRWLMNLIWEQQWLESKCKFMRKETSKSNFTFSYKEKFTRLNFTQYESDTRKKLRSWF